MFDDISARTDFNGIKSKIAENYMRGATGIVNSEEYKRFKRKAISKIFLYNFIYIITNIVIWALFYYSGVQGEDIIALSIYMAIFAVIAIPCIIGFQNRKFACEIKKYCTKYILKGLSKLKYSYDSENETRKSCITEEDIKKCILDLYTSEYTDDVFEGVHKNNEYTFKEIKLYRGSGKNRQTIFEGTVLKTVLNTGVIGEIEINSKDFIFNSVNLSKFVIILILICIFIDIILTVLALIHTSATEEIPLVFIFLAFSSILFLVFAILLSKYFYKKQVINGPGKQPSLFSNIIQNINYALTGQPSRLKENRNAEDINVNENFVIHACDAGVIDYSKITELTEVLEQLMYLFNTKKISCKLYDDNILLTISTPENLFEQGNLFNSPTKKKVAERVIMQLTGIYLFVDFISSTYNTEPVEEENEYDNNF